MHVRLAIADDAQALVDVATASGLATSLAEFDALRSDAATTMYVAIDEDGGGPVGFLALREHAPPACVQARRPLQLWRLYVRPDFHGKGVARTLTGRALVHAHAKGHDVVWLGTDPDNARAIGFYRKCGFRNAGRACLHGDHAEDVDQILACVLGGGID
jgi:ribosomal protein S18 acetylase RimI-like enzyme